LIHGRKYAGSIPFHDNLFAGQVLLCLAAVVAVAASRPRYLIIDLDDLTSLEGAGAGALGQLLSRQARQVRQEEAGEYAANKPPGYNRRQEYEEPAVAPR
jgi:hypothetical protein